MPPATKHSAAIPDEPASHDEAAPFSAPVRANFVLTGPDSSGEKRHIEVDLRGSGLTYEPGDALGIVARNDPATIERVLAGLGVTENAIVEIEGRPLRFGEALATRFEIAVASPRFLRHWALLSGSRDLLRLAAPEATEARRRYLRENHIGDIVRRHPVPGIDAKAVLAGLRPLRPRLFSIASSLRATPDLAAITTATLSYCLHGEMRRGVVSGYQLPHAAPGSRLPVYVEPDPAFRLPADDVPVIMVGAGTGVAPFRAFLAERRAREAPGRSWLVFGGRTSASDFLYRAEWQEALDDGYLAQLDLAFSRDISSPKTYVQHRLLQRGKAIYAWLEDGATFYVCGDAARMAPAVHAALLEIVGTHGRLDRDGALDYVARLSRAHRYRRSIY